MTELEYNRTGADYEKLRAIATQISKHSMTLYSLDRRFIPASSVASSRKRDPACITMPVMNGDIDKFHNYINHNWKMSNAYKVKQFTEGSKGITCPKIPTPIDRTRGAFILKMILSECVEFAQTLCDTPEEAQQFVKDCMGTDIKPHTRPDKDVD